LLTGPSHLLSKGENDLTVCGLLPQSFSILRFGDGAKALAGDLENDAFAGAVPMKFNGVVEDACLGVNAAPHDGPVHFLAVDVVSDGQSVGGEIVFCPGGVVGLVGGVVVEIEGFGALAVSARGFGVEAP